MMRRILVFIMVTVSSFTMYITAVCADAPLDTLYDYVASLQFSREMDNVSILGWSFDWGSGIPWSLNERIKLIEFMTNANIELPQDEINLISSNEMNLDRVNRIVDKLIKNYYGEGRDGILNLADIIAKDEGPIEFWSLERKAWYDAMREKYSDWYTIEVYGGALLPCNEDMPFEEAYLKAKAILLDQYGFTQTDFDKAHRIDVSFYENGIFEGSTPGRQWDFEFWLDEYPEETDNITFGIQLTGTGEFIRVWLPYYMM